MEVNCTGNYSFSCHLGFNQSYFVNILGNLSTTEDESLGGVNVTLWEDADSITSVITSWNGDFLFETEFEKRYGYKLTFDYEYQKQNDIIVKSASDSLITQEYVLNVQLLKNELEAFSNDSEIYFELNKV